jgi:hypothetical protein
LKSFATALSTLVGQTAAPAERRRRDLAPQAQPAMKACVTWIGVTMAGAAGLSGPFGASAPVAEQPRGRVTECDGASIADALTLLDVLHSSTLPGNALGYADALGIIRAVGERRRARFARAGQPNTLPAVGSARQGQRACEATGAKAIDAFLAVDQCLAGLPHAAVHDLSNDLAPPPVTNRSPARRLGAVTRGRATVGFVGLAHTATALRTSLTAEVSRLALEVVPARRIGFDGSPTGKHMFTGSLAVIGKDVAERGAPAVAYRRQTSVGLTLIEVEISTSDEPRRLPFHVPGSAARNRRHAKMPIHASFHTRVPIFGRATCTKPTDCAGLFVQPLLHGIVASNSRRHIARRSSSAASHGHGENHDEMTTASCMLGHGRMGGRPVGGTAVQISGRSGVMQR